MANLQYNFMDNAFTVYEPVATPKVPKLNLPLMEDIDISDWAYGISPNGVPLAKGKNKEEFKFNNPEEHHPEVVSYSVNPNLSESKKYAMDFFKSKGLSAHQAAGIVGNLLLESNLDTKRVGDKGTSYGIAQWHKERWTNLKNFAKSKGTHESDLNTQLEFLWSELNSSYKSALDGLLSSRNVDEATTLFMKQFEKPNLKLANLNARIKFANSLIV